MHTRSAGFFEGADRPAASPPQPQAVLVNDDATQGRILAELLKKAGMEPAFYQEAEAALAEMDPHAPPALIVTDLYMRGIDGWRFCRLLRSPDYAAFNQVPILVVSATYSGEESAQITSGLGANGFMSLPVNPAEFILRVHLLLKGGIQTDVPRMLIVEDSALIARRVAAFFREQGHEVDSCATLADARNFIREKRYDLAVLDYHLPDGLGDALLEELASLLPDCVSIMITVDPDPTLALKWMKMGAAAYVHKPFQPEYLLEQWERARRERNLLRIHELLDARTRQYVESEVRYDQLAEGVPACICSFLPDGTITYANAMLAALVDAAPRDIVGKNVFDMLEPQDLVLVRTALQSLSPQNPTEVHEQIFMGKDGTPGYYEWRNRAFFDSAGDVTRFQGVGIDISGRRKNEEALRKQSQYHRSVLQTTRDGFWLIDTAGRIIEVNDAYCQMSGYSQEEILRMGIPDLDPYEDAQVTTERIRRIQERGYELFVTRHRRKDGSPMDVEVSATFMPLEGGRFICFCRDITNRKREEAELRAAYIKLDALWNITSLQETDIKTISDHILATITRMTDSAFGFYGFVDENEEIMTIHAWSGAAMAECAVVDQPQHFSVEKAGIWAEAIRRREPFILNHYQDDHKAKKGLPDGHVPLTNLLVVPHFTHGKITALAATANRIDDYTSEDLNQVSAFLTSIHALVDSIRAEEALRRSEALLNETEQLARVGGWSWDVVSQMMDWSDETYRIHGFSSEEIRAKSPEHIQRSLDCYHPEDRARIRTAFQRCLTEGVPYDLEVRFTSVTGDEKWVRTMGRAILEGERVVRVMGNLMDITERKQTEKELLLKSLVLDQIKDHVTITDLEGRITYVNQAEVETFGYARDDLIGKTVAIYGEDSQKGATQKEIQETTLRDGLWRCEVVNYAADGREHIMDCRTQVVRDAQGDPIALCGIATDITERKRTEKALRASEERYHLIDESSQDMIYSYDRNGRFTHANTRLCQFMKIPADQIVGKTHAELGFPRELCDDWAALHEQVYATDRTVISETTAPSASGEIEDFEVVLNPMHDEEGNIIGIAGTTRNITERKRAEEKIRRQIEELTRWQKVTLGREKRIMELKREVNDLLTATGKAPRYASVMEADAV